MAEKLYRVKDWQESFEGAKSKNYKNKSSCQMPCKHGLGFRRLVMRDDGAAYFGAWCAMIQVLSRQDSPRDGYLTDNGRHDGEPLTPEDLEVLTGIKSAVFSGMLSACSSKGIRWLTDTTRIPQGYHADTTRIP